jgi:hypothetical protein
LAFAGSAPAKGLPSEIIRSSRLNLLQGLGDGGGQLIGKGRGVEVVMLFKQLANDHTPTGHGAPQAVFQLGIVLGSHEMNPHRQGPRSVSPMQEIEIIEATLFTLRGL